MFADTQKAKAFAYSDLPDGSDSFVLSIAKLNVSAGLISREQFIERVNDIRNGIMAEQERVNKKTEMLALKSRVKAGEAPPPSEFGQTMQKARADKNWSQKELGMKLSVTANQIANWEKGVGLFPTDSQRVQLNRHLGVVLPKKFR